MEQNIRTAKEVVALYPSDNWNNTAHPEVKLDFQFLNISHCATLFH